VNTDKRTSLITPSNSEDQIAIIGKKFDIKGDLNGIGAVIISGKIEGNISASQVVIERGGVVLGNIACSQIDISGQVRGTIDAADVVIRDKASIEGDLSYSSIAMESGCTISGKLKQTAPKQQATVETAQTIAHPPPTQNTYSQGSISIPLPIELCHKLRLHEARMSAHLSLIDGNPAPPWIELNQDKLGLTVDALELQQLQEKKQAIEMRLHVGSHYFDFNLPNSR